MKARSFNQQKFWSKWDDDPEFKDIYNKMAQKSLVDVRRLYTLCELARHCNSIDGDVAELGVCEGGTARLIARLMPEKEVHLFDTFEGLPETHLVFDMMIKGQLKAELSQVKEFLSDLKNVRFRPGFFPQTATGLENKEFCFAHIDADIYQSIKDACEFFYPRMAKGGMMVFDDYGYFGTKGAKKAVDEFFQDRAEYPMYLISHQCLVVKL